MKQIYGFLCLLLSLAAFATNPSPSNNDGNWSEHAGTFIGTQIGFNLNKIYLNDSYFHLKAHTSFHAVSQGLYIGHYFSPHWGLEAEISSYFSGLGLAGIASIKGNLPLSHKVALFTNLGAAYIGTSLDRGFIGPYASAGLSYALSAKLDIQASFSDIYSNYQFTKYFHTSNNFLSLLCGFTYHI